MLNFDENNKTIDIPDFVEDKSENSNSVDISIFNMSDDELYDDVDKNDDGNKQKKKANSTIILCLVVIGILLVASVLFGLYAFKEHNKVSTLTNENTQLIAKNKENEAQIADLQTTIGTLTAENEQLKNGGNTADPDNKYPAGTVLYITKEGNSVGLKEKASMDSDFATPKVTYYHGDKVTLIGDATIDSDGNYWAEVEGGFIRITYKGEVWATTEPQ